MSTQYRVDELAALGGVTVDTVRFYQTRRLLPRPERSGRAAWYGDAHLERLLRIRDLKARGFTLAMIDRVLAGELDADEEALALALAGPLPDEAADRLLTLPQLAEHTGVSLALLEACEREGLLLPRTDDGEERYTAEDAEVVSAGLALLESGVPLSELMALARLHDEAMRAVTTAAVDLFARYVRDPIRAEAATGDEAAERMVTALQTMIPATSAVVAHHFRRRLLAAARARIEQP